MARSFSSTGISHCPPGLGLGTGVTTINRWRERFLEREREGHRRGQRKGLNEPGGSADPVGGKGASLWDPRVSQSLVPSWGEGCHHFPNKPASLRKAVLGE